MEAIAKRLRGDFHHIRSAEALVSEADERTISVEFHTLMSGVKKVILRFLRDRKNRTFAFAPTKRREEIDIEHETLTISILVHRFVLHNDHFLYRLIRNTIRYRVRGNTAELKAFELFSQIAATEDDVAPPILTRTNLLIKSYDLQVPVRSSRANGIVLVPIQVKSSVVGQQKHISHYPRIPSIVIDAHALGDEEKRERAIELLRHYVNKAEVLHV